MQNKNNFFKSETNSSPRRISSTVTKLFDLLVSRENEIPNYSEFLIEIRNSNY